MIRYLTLLSMVILTNIGLFAQFKVTGEVVDSTATGVPYATLRVFAESSTDKPAVVGTTDLDGLFTLDLPRAGSYTLRINSVGNQPVELPFSVTSAKPRADMRRITIRQADNLLQAVEVVAQRPLVVAEADRLSYDIQADEESKTSTIMEMLRKVPMVTVDGQDNITVNGSSNFKIYKNGRPNNSFTNNAKDVLKSIPASTIKRIEVITEPGAQYDAEGVSGILNIVTLESSRMIGATGSVRASMSTQGNPGVGAYVTSQIDKFTMSANYGYFSMNSKRNFTDDVKTFLSTGDTSVTRSAGKNPGYGNYVDLEGSYEIDSLNLVTVSFGGFFYKIKPEGTNSIAFYDAAGDPVYSYKSDYYMRHYDNYDFNGKLDYQHLTSRKGESLIFSYLMSTSTNKEEQAIELSDFVNTTLPYDSYTLNQNLRFWEHTFQLDWTRPLSQHHTINLGAKYILRDNRSIQSQRFLPSSAGDYDSHFNHDTHVAAAYTEYVFNSGPWNLRGGLRYEYSYLGARFHDGSTPDFHQNLSDLVPSLALSYRINPFNHLRFNFATRINRPGISYLNPAVNESPTLVSQGNPDLSSARNNSLRLTYMLMKPKITMSVNAGYNFSNDQIMQVSTSRDNVIYNTYGNIGNDRNFSASGFIQWRATPSTQLMANFGGGYRRIANNSIGLSNSRWYYNLFAQLSQQLPWKLRLEAGGTVNSSAPSLYGHSAPMCFYFLGLGRSFLKDDRLTVRLSGTQMFSGQYMSIKSYTTQGDYVGRSCSSMPIRQIGLSVSLRFGSLKAQVKKAIKSIENDDVVGGQSAASQQQSSTPSN